MRLLNGIDRLLAGIEYALIAVLTLIALALGVMQVILRYGFGTGLHWAEQGFVLLTVTAMLMAGVRAVAQDRHVRVDLLANALPTIPRRILELVSLLIALALCLTFAWCGYRFVTFARMMDLRSIETDIPEWITYSLVPVTMGLFALRYVLRIIRLLQGEAIGGGHDAPLEAREAVEKAAP